MEKVETRGIHHLGLTVPDVETTSDFFISTLGFKKIGGKPDYPAVFLSDGVTTLTLWQVKNKITAVPFDRKNNIGLHHFALRVKSADQLDAACKALACADGTEVEFGPESLGGGSTMHMMFTIPGGLRVELIAPTD